MVTAAMKLKNSCSLEEKLDSILNKPRQHIKNRDINTIIAGDFNTHSHQWTDHQNRKLIRKHNTLDEMDFFDIFRTFHPNAEEYTFFSTAHGTFPRIGHILGHKSNLSKFKKTEIISSIFSDMQ